MLELGNNWGITGESSTIMKESPGTADLSSN